MRKNDAFTRGVFRVGVHTHIGALYLVTMALNVGEYHVRNSSRCVRALCTGETGHNKRPLSMFGMLWIGVYGSVFQFLPKSSNFAQPLKRSGPTFYRPQSTTWSTLLALFHCMVRHGTVRYGSLLGGFPLGTVPGTWYFFSTTSVEVPCKPYRYQNVTCKLCWSLIGLR